MDECTGHYIFSSIENTQILSCYQSKSEKKISLLHPPNGIKIFFKYVSPVNNNNNDDKTFLICVRISSGENIKCDWKIVWCSRIQINSLANTFHRVYVNLYVERKLVQIQIFVRYLMMFSSQIFWLKTISWADFFGWAHFAVSTRNTYYRSQLE